MHFDFDFLVNKVSFPLYIYIYVYNNNNSNNSNNISKSVYRKIN